MTALDYLYMNNGTYAEGAKKSTAGKPLRDDNFDKLSPENARKIRKQTHWLNVNSTDIPAMVAKATARTIGVSVNTQVESHNNNFNNDAEAFLKTFHEIGVGELTNKHHGNSAFRAISDFDLLDGGIMIRHHYNAKWKIPYKYELVPVDMIDVSKGAGFRSGKPYELNGLVYNKWNQITHIYLYTNDDKIKSEPVSVENITYYSDVWVSIGQQTAISKLATILPKLDQIDQYAKAELNSAIEAAKSGAFLKSTAYNEIMLVLRDQIEKQSPSGKQNKLDSAIDFAKPILDRLSSIGVKPYGLTPIPSEDSIEFDSRKRDSVFKTLNDNSEMKMSAALNMSDIAVYGKAGEANYSAIKFAAEIDQLGADIRFDNISKKVLNEINKRAVQVGVQIGKIKERVSYWKDPSVFHKFRYLRQIHIDIEPSKNAQANKSNIENGLDTHANIIEKREGVPYENWLAKEEENEKLRIIQKLRLEKFEVEMREKEGLIIIKEQIEDTEKKEQQLAAKYIAKVQNQADKLLEMQNEKLKALQNKVSL